MVWFAWQQSVSSAGYGIQRVPHPLPRDLFSLAAILLFSARPRHAGCPSRPSPLAHALFLPRHTGRLCHTNAYQKTKSLVLRRLPRLTPLAVRSTPYIFGLFLLLLVPATTNFVSQRPNISFSMNTRHDLHLSTRRRFDGAAAGATAERKNPSAR